jgi:hypothetical protein
MTDPRTPRTEAGRALLRYWGTLVPDPNMTTMPDFILAIEREAAAYPSDEALAEALHRAGVQCRPNALHCSRVVHVHQAARLIRQIEASGAAVGSSERLAAALERLRLMTASRDAYAQTVSALRQVILAADPALSDPDAERQRAIGEAVERLDNATLPSTSLEIQKPSDWTLGLGQTDRKDWLVNVWDGSDSVATALGRDLVETIDHVIASLSESSCDCPSFDAEVERDCCCVGGEACRPDAALPAAQEAP